MNDPEAVLSLLRSEEITAASALLAAALQDDPGWAHVVADPGRRRLALRAVTRTALRDAIRFGTVHAARVADRVVGVAVWLPPGRYPMTPPRKARTLPAMTALALRLPRDIRAGARFGAGVDAAFPAEPVWYLQVLGVHPDMQGRGLGARLLGPAMTEARRSATPCYLETALPSNVDYYRRFGFDPAAPAAQLHPGGPLMVRMRTAAPTA